MEKRLVIDLKSIWSPKGERQAENELLPQYIKDVLSRLCPGVDLDVILTGTAPIWMYSGIACALVGKVPKLIYNSPQTGDVILFERTR